MTLKSAVSLDGFTATASGDSRWISGPESRALVHRWRAESDAVAVGIGTALADDPLLTARDVDDPDARQPARVVFDSAARLPLDSALVRSIETGAAATCSPAPDADRRASRRCATPGAEVIELAGDRDRRLAAALDELGRRGITSLLVEGGAELAGSLLAAGEVDELRVFIAPLVLGGGRPLAAGAGAERIADGDRAAGGRVGAVAARTCSPARGCGSGEPMFTGIVEEVGAVEAVDVGRGRGAARDRGRASPGELREGDSVAVEGVCLTATAVRARRLRRRRHEPDAVA